MRARSASRPSAKPSDTPRKARSPKRERRGEGAPASGAGTGGAAVATPGGLRLHGRRRSDRGSAALDLAEQVERLLVDRGRQWRVVQRLDLRLALRERPVDEVDERLALVLVR